MKAVTQYINPYPIEVKCSFCSKKLVRNKYYLKRYPISFCSQPCKTFFNDPKQSLIMNMQQDNNFYYLIGLLCTDGYINYPGGSKNAITYSCVIKLSTKDENILYNIQKIFGGTITYEDSNGFKIKKKGTICWRIINKDFIEYLKSIGLTNNKTYTLNISNWFNNLTREQKAAFIRGCYDGDGSINIDNMKLTDKKICTTSICSASKTFIEMISNYLSNFKGILHERKKEQSKLATCSLYTYYLNSKEALTLGRIYGNLKETDLCLERKRKKFEEIRSYYNTFISRNTHSILHGPKKQKGFSKWISSIIYNNKRYNLGSYINENEAAIAYDIAYFKFKQNMFKINFTQYIEKYKEIVKQISIENFNCKEMPIIVENFTRSISASKDT